MFSLPLPRHIPTLHDPEAFECVKEFRLLRCCGREMIAPSSVLQNPRQTHSFELGIDPQGILLPSPFIVFSVVISVGGWTCGGIVPEAVGIVTPRPLCDIAAIKVRFMPPCP